MTTDDREARSGTESRPDEAAEPDPAPAQDSLSRSEIAGVAAVGICPYLRSPDGWRTAAPSREHRCTAVQPAARLSSEKQARLCLVSEHESCATFVAAREARAARGLAPRTGMRPIARTLPTVVEPARAGFALGLRGTARRIGQGGIGVLMIVAVIAIVLARNGGVPSPAASAAPGSLAAATAAPSLPAASELATASAAPSGSPAQSSAPTATAAPTPATTPPASPSRAPTPAPTAASSPAPSGSFVRYTVKAGDTLSAIAAKYKTTVQAILDANGIKVNDVLRIGQVLLIPK